MSEQQVQHWLDEDRYYNGSDGGPWAICGERYEPPKPGVKLPDCVVCVDLWMPLHERRGSRA